ncbi:MAG: hypothetical protein HQ541_23005 [Mariniphaga sp.]|nr:hypothetical protein [Mariniphaga sp.]
MNSFDHSKTNYILEGRHLTLDCTKCHKGSYTNPVKHSLCSDCHDDYHNNQFLKNNIKPDCSDCHSVQNFTSSNYTIEKHNLLDFKLNGSHLATPCFQCHKKEDKWSFRNIGSGCTNCHENVHQNYIQEKYFNNGSCNNCHNETAWNLTDFDHKKTDFPLEGKHADVSCRQCHYSEKKGISVQHFKELNQNCVTCHPDIHYYQFVENNKTDCGKCHTNENWKPEKFNHEKARFKIDGKHIGLDCIKCHKPIVENGKRFVKYKFEDISCASCHS